MSHRQISLISKLQSQGYKEEKNLVVLYGSNESSQCHEEQKDSNANDAPNYLETRDKAKPLSPGSDADHQHTHHLQEEGVRESERIKTPILE